MSNDKVAQRDLLREDNPNKDKINRAGLHVIFHLDSSYAMNSPALCGELLSSVVADCFHYQVDVIGGDGNSSAYRFGGSNQRSSSNEQSLFQESSNPSLCQRHFEGPGQDQIKGQRSRKVSLPVSSEPETLSPKRYGIAQLQVRFLQFALGIFTKMVRCESVHADMVVDLDQFV